MSTPSNEPNPLPQGSTGHPPHSRPRLPGARWIAITWAVFGVFGAAWLAVAEDATFGAGTESDDFWLVAFLLAFISLVTAATTTIMAFSNGSASFTPYPLPRDGRPYHLLGLLGGSAAHRFLRPAADLLLAVVVHSVLFIAVTIVVGRPEPAWLYSASTLGAAFLPAVLIAVRLTGRRAGSVSSVAGVLRLRRLAACAVGGLAVTLVEVLVQLLVLGDGWQRDSWPGAAAWWPAAGVAVLTVPLSVGGLVYLQGMALQVFGAWTLRRWPAIVLAAAVTTAAGFPDDPSEVATFAAIGLATWWLTIRTGGLEAALGLVVVHPLVFELVRQSQAVDGSTGQVADPSLLEALPSDLVQVLAVLAYTWWVVRTAPGTGRRDGTPTDDDVRSDPPASA